MKRYILLSILFLTACAGGIDPRVYPTATIVATAMPTWTETPTMQPTPTIGYEATAMIAQQTAEAAMRLNVAVTAEAEQRLHQEMAWTAEADARQQEVLGWTATAASTSVALTATQQAALNTQIPAQQALMAAQIEATQSAPTLIVAMSRAQLALDYGWVDPLAILFVSFSVGIFLIACSWQIYKDDERKRERQRRIEQQKAVTGKVMDEEAHVIVPIDLPMTTTVNLKSNTSGSYSSRRLIVPCSAEQLTELADGLISGRKTLAFNQWEGKSSQHFTRPIFQQVRAFLQINKLAKSAAGAGNLILTDDGEAFLRGWLDSRSLPHSYEFEPESQGVQGESAHDHENHGRDLPVVALSTAIPMRRLI